MEDIKALLCTFEACPIISRIILEFLKILTRILVRIFDTFTKVSQLSYFTVKFLFAG